MKLIIEEESKIREAQRSHAHTRATSGECKEQRRRMSHTGLTQNLHSDNSEEVLVAGKSTQAPNNLSQ